MTKNYKMFFLSFIVCVLLAGFSFLLIKNKEAENSSATISNTKETHIVSSSNDESLQGIEENKYYIIYLKETPSFGYPASSFIPEALNPDFDPYEGSQVSISFNDFGEIINDEKIIMVENYRLSKNNIEEIKQIVGSDSYQKAITEIEERINETISALKTS